jgi:hypothetical protein
MKKKRTILKKTQVHPVIMKTKKRARIAIKLKRFAKMKVYQEYSQRTV